MPRSNRLDGGVVAAGDLLSIGVGKGGLAETLTGGGEYHSISSYELASLFVPSPSSSESSLSETRAESDKDVGEIVKADKNA
jgi:hypothetical protein